MEQVGNIKLYSLEEVMDEDIGNIARAFKAMGIPANLAFGKMSLALW